MQTWRIALLACVALPAGTQSISSLSDDRIELMGIVFRLAGNSEYNQCRVPRYNRAIDEWFGPHAQHPAIVAARRLRHSSRLGYSAVMSLAVHLTPLPSLDERRDFADSGLAMEMPVGGGRIRPFLQLVRQFARDSRAAEFFLSQKAIRDTASARLGAIVRRDFDATWFERFFGPRPGVRLVIVPGTCLGGANFGPRFLGRDGASELYAVVGASAVDSAGWPEFDPRSALPLLSHEFNHSFVNPAFDTVSTLEAAARAVHARSREAMQRQGYDWRALVNESVVRAASARFEYSRNGAAAARSALDDEAGRGFLWASELYDLLGRYETNRRAYATFDRFVPEVVRYFDRLATRVDSMTLAWEAKRPRVQSATPVSGDTAVSPSTSAIVVKFDRAMSSGYSISTGPLGAKAYPEVLGQSFDASRTTFTLQVRLRPESEYQLVLTGLGFRSADGVPIGSTTLSFRTRSTP